jgi:hypothetical protein
MRTDRSFLSSEEIEMADSVIISGKTMHPIMTKDFLVRLNNREEFTVSSIDLNYTEMTINVQLYEYIDESGVTNVDRFLKRIRKSKSLKVPARLEVDALQGDGAVLYTEVFRSLAIIDVSGGFDYDNKSIRKVSVTLMYDRHRKLRKAV